MSDWIFNQCIPPKTAVKVSWVQVSFETSYHALIIVFWISYLTIIPLFRSVGLFLQNFGWTHHQHKQFKISRNSSAHLANLLHANKIQRIFASRLSWSSSSIWLVWGWSSLIQTHSHHTPLDMKSKPQNSWKEHGLFCSIDCDRP